MGTRSVAGVRIDGADKLSYNHYDGDPEGVGLDILKELIERFKDRDYDDVVGELKQKARTMRQVEENDKPTEFDIRKMQALGTVNLNVSAGSVQDWYCLAHGHQGSILKRLDAGVCTNNNSFINDSLFCEWGYILNLDEEVLEVYKGFQKKPHDKGRYASFVPTPEKGERMAFYACALVRTYPLKHIADDETLAGLLMIGAPADT